MLNIRSQMLSTDKQRFCIKRSSGVLGNLAQDLILAMKNAQI